MTEAAIDRDRAQLEQLLLGIWRDVLEMPELRPDDDLFDHGNRSIVMLKVYMELKLTHGVEVPLTAMFDLATVDDFVSYLRGSADGDGVA